MDYIKSNQMQRLCDGDLHVERALTAKGWVIVTRHKDCRDEFADLVVTLWDVRTIGDSPLKLEL